MMIRITMLLIVGIACISPLVQASPADTQAEVLYNQYQESVYQIRVIEKTSGNKAVTGSGFQITPEGHIATNYHVVSELIHYPEMYRLEYVRPTGETGPLELLDIDVVNDLAIVIGDDLQATYFPLGQASLEKGMRIYSLGNPHDLGMAIVEGTYNGLLEKSLYEKIFFSGSLNPGMSGGPAIDSEGNVIGINVSRMEGNQLSFLVPVHYLTALLEDVKQHDSQPVADFYQRIEAQLLNNQKRFAGALLEADWETKPLGEAVVPGEIAKFFKCWGDSDKEKDLLYTHTNSHCSTDDDIYLSSTSRTGVVRFWFDWYAEKGLHPVRFYNVYDRAFQNLYGSRRSDKEDLTAYACKTDFVDVNAKTWKVALCVRKYKKYPRLYEFVMAAALVSEYDKGLIANFVISGVEKTIGLQLSQKFLEAIQWKK